MNYGETIQKKLGLLETNVGSLKSIILQYQSILGNVANLVNATKENVKVLELISKRLDNPNEELTKTIASMQENLGKMNQVVNDGR